MKNYLITISIGEYDHSFCVYCNCVNRAYELGLAVRDKIAIFDGQESTVKVEGIE